MSGQVERPDEKERKALVAALAVADRWEDVLSEVKATDPRWILDPGAMALDSCLSELRHALRPAMPSGGTP